MDEAEEHLPHKKSTDEATLKTLLQGYKQCLEEIRNIFLFEIDRRRISTSDIDSVETDLRNMLRGIEHARRNNPYIYTYISSPLQLQTKISNTLTQLYIISDLLARKPSHQNSKLLYHHISHVPIFLLDIIDILEKP